MCGIRALRALESCSAALVGQRHLGSTVRTGGRILHPDSVLVSDKSIYAMRTRCVLDVNTLLENRSICVCARPV